MPTAMLWNSSPIPTTTMTAGDLGKADNRERLG